ncbi:MAG: hypothetical protein IKO41_21505 [Lachnospiraceae bacterium]|nr:hypothetical protein [Lachnospiraceae bacterium]
MLKLITCKICGKKIVYPKTNPIRNIFSIEGDAKNAYTNFSEDELTDIKNSNLEVSEHICKGCTYKNYIVYNDYTKKYETIKYNLQKELERIYKNAFINAKVDFNDCEGLCNKQHRDKYITENHAQIKNAVSKINIDFTNFKNKVVSIQNVLEKDQEKLNNDSTVCKTYQVDCEYLPLEIIDIENNLAKYTDGTWYELSTAGSIPTTFNFKYDATEIMKYTWFKELFYKKVQATTSKICV